ncbi:hypothetical protein AK830_g6906 [Neonectria ditissima]|uniref:asparaginase n=1 Tax=Neonectria ditissima TaxID=78410 RepID=A0A0N8H6Q8_9HYPO|nr:hypothetical protein AK830_g6906 [Neonectria ditissima]
MLSSLLTTVLVATATIASPLQIQKREDPNTGLTWIYKDPSLPKDLQYRRWDHPVRLQQRPLGQHQLRRRPWRSDAGNAYRHPGPAANADSDRFLNISMDTHKRMCTPHSDIVGAVMIHGTNTLAETAFGVDLTLNCSKPFVATGSMRPNSALSPDGPFNFYDAVRAAIHPESRDRGAMIAFNDHLVSAFYGTKTNGNTVSTFLATDQGYIGQFIASQPYYFYGPSLPKARHHFNPFKLKYPLPQVVVLYGHQGFKASLLYAAAADGAKGIVIMGVGPGGLSTTARAAAEDLFTQGVVTVASLRPSFGAVVPGPAVSNITSSGFLHGEQSRIQLQLALASGYDVAGIRKLFEGDIRKAVYNRATAFYHATTL